MPNIKDRETRILASISESLKGEYIDPVENEWERSPFAWIPNRRSPAQRGKIGEQLVAGWCASRDLNVVRSPDRDADRIIEGRRVEIKFSTLWSKSKNSKKRNYLFQQIRDQNYDYLLCLGVSPFAAHAWIMKKSEIPFGKLGHQHGGKRGRDTWWLFVEPNDIPAWLKVHGGTLAKVLKVLRTFRRA